MTEEKTKLVLWGPPCVGKTTMVEMLWKKVRRNPLKQGEKPFVFKDYDDNPGRLRYLPGWGSSILETEFSLDQKSYFLQWSPGSPYKLEEVIPYLLKDAKGILFVVNLARHCSAENSESLKQLEEHLPQFAGHSLSSFPVVVCYNKIDCAHIRPLYASAKKAFDQESGTPAEKYFKYIHKHFNPHNFPWICTVGYKGVNVKAAFLKLIELVTYWENHESLPKEACSGEGTVPASFSWKPTGKDYEEEDRYSWDPPEDEEEVVVVVEEDEKEPKEDAPKDPPSEAGIEDLFG